MASQFCTVATTNFREPIHRKQNKANTSKQSKLKYDLQNACKQSKIQSNWNKWMNEFICWAIFQWIFSHKRRRTYDRAPWKIRYFVVTLAFNKAMHFKHRMKQIEFVIDAELYSIRLSCVCSNVYHTQCSVLNAHSSHSHRFIAFEFLFIFFYE